MTSGADRREKRSAWVQPTGEESPRCAASSHSVGCRASGIKVPLPEGNPGPVRQALRRCGRVPGVSSASPKRATIAAISRSAIVATGTPDVSTTEEARA